MKTKRYLICIIALLGFFVYGCQGETTWTTTTLTPTTLEPTTPSTSEPTTLPPTTSVPTTFTSTSQGPTTLPPTSVPPTTHLPLFYSETETYVMDSGDLVLAIGWHDYVFSGMTGHEITTADYAMHMAGLTLSGSYLTGLGIGTYHFSIVTDHGTYPLEIEVVYITPYQEPVLFFPLGSNVYTMGLSLGLTAHIDLDGAPLLSVSINQDVINPAFYQHDGSSLELIPEALAALSYSPAHRLQITTEAGSAQALFIVNDIPTIQEKSDFIKYPGEAIIEEDWTDLVSNQIGTLSFRYETEAEGTFTDHLNGRFSFVPASTYYGSETISLIVEDQYGAQAQRMITLTYKQIDPLILDTETPVVIDKATLEDDRSFIVHTYGTEPNTLYFEMIEIRDGSTPIEAEHYILKTDQDPSRFSLKATYLVQLSLGIHRLTLVTEAGFSDFDIDIRDTRPVKVAPESQSFTIGLSEDDLSFTLTPYAHIVTSSSFTIHGEALIENVDFTYVAPVFTIKKAFLESLTIGNHMIEINDVSAITVKIHTVLSPEVIDDDVLQLWDPFSEETLDIPVNLKGLASETRVFRFQVELDHASYTLTDDLLTLDAIYLAGLDEGYHEFFLINTQGTTGFILRNAGRPTPSSSDQNVTKFTHEVISTEALRVVAALDGALIAAHMLEVRYYPFQETVLGDPINGSISVDTLSGEGDFGIVTLDPQTMTFAFFRNAGWYGLVQFTYTATDDFGWTSDPIQMEVVYKPLHPIIADDDSKYHHPGTFSDITMTITNHEGIYRFPIEGITCGIEALVLDQDYTVGPESGSYLYFTILGTYLDALSPGTHTFVVTTSGGRGTFYVHVVAGLTTPGAVDDFDQGDPEDLVIPLEGFPLLITELKIQDAVVSTAYWTFVDDQLRVDSAFLGTLSYGTKTLQLNNGYAESTIDIVIMDSRMPVLSGSVPAYTLGTLMDKTVTFNLYDKILTGLEYQGTAVDSEHYEIHNHQLILKGTYLESLQAQPMWDFTVITSAGTIPISMEVVTIITPPSIAQTSDPLAIDGGGDIYFSLDLNGNTFAGLSYDDMELETEDYGIDGTSGDLWLSLGFLLKIYDRTIDTFWVAFHTLEADPVYFEVLYDAPKNRVLNGGFEHGDLLGFQSYGLWKDESGLVAFRNERVVETGFYGSGNDHPYNKDGRYHFGLYTEPYDNQNKDINQERMGMLRSGNFTLGGSGWISFKMGGGRNAGVAYISVHDAQTHIEIARFGNRHFNQTSVSGTANAEGYMFLYYYDLSAHLGQELYFLVVDQASHEWSVLALDSLYTYYEVAPETHSDTLAINILPQIARMDDPTHDMIEGNLTSSLGNWENPQGIFQIGNGGTISSVGGNSAMGVLRSPAFTIENHPFLKYDFAGAIAKDKQVFVLVKEVGTNLEVLRLVRRDDLASQGDSGDFKSHWTDLSVLDPEKAYYLEVVDNRDGDWGVALIRNVRLEATPDVDYRRAVNTYYGLAQV
ncbi:MAG: hypothetical protein PHO96_03305, partial [Candidatus Izemoplasmatales bacterium]|nr:hypothetical protein [Candidatus Izemoplasmatales bacterium]